MMTAAGLGIGDSPLAPHRNYDNHSDKREIHSSFPRKREPSCALGCPNWVPAFAGMTKRRNAGLPTRADLSDTFCPVGRSAELLGDRAVLLILRDLFFGRRRFEAIAANTGLGPQLVSARLKLMEKEGVVARHIYQEHPPRYEYR